MQALELASVVVDGLAPRPLPLYLWPDCRVVDLSWKGTDDDKAAAAAGVSSEENASSLVEEKEEGRAAPNGVSSVLSCFVCRAA